MTEPDASNNGMPTPLTGSQVPRRAPDRRRRNGGLGHGLGDVDALLAAATDRAHPQELAGEEAAIAAFRQAHRASASPAGRTRRLVPVPGLIAGSLTAKLAISLGVLSFGGFALAAETGSLPTGAQSAAHRVFRAIGVPEGDQQASEQTGDRTSDRTGQPTQSNGGGPQLDATSPAVTGLCRAYTAGNKDEHGKALDSTAFQALAKAAGGEADIEAFCAGVLANSGSGPSPSPSATPGPTTSPSPSASPSEDETSPEATPTSPSERSNGHAHPRGPSHPASSPTDLPAPAKKGKP